MYKLNNEYNIYNTDFSQGKCPVLLLLPEEEVVQVIKWLKKLKKKLRESQLGETKDFVITNLGMRVNTSLLVFNLL